MRFNVLLLATLIGAVAAQSSSSAPVSGSIPASGSVAPSSATTPASSSASAAIPTSTAVPACVNKCSSDALTSTKSKCKSVTDVPCICNDTAFKTAAEKCIASTCTKAEADTATALQKAVCPAVASGSGSGAPAASGSKSGAPAASGSKSGSPAVPSKNAASRSLQVGGGVLAGVLGGLAVLA